MDDNNSAQELLRRAASIRMSSEMFENIKHTITMQMVNDEEIIADTLLFMDMLLSKKEEIQAGQADGV